jgi:hypothetical protein
LTDPAALVAILGVAACLVLATRRLRHQRPAFNRTLIMGVIWAAIIAALALVLQRYMH